MKAAILALFFVGLAPTKARPPSFEAARSASDTGSYRLSWKSNGGEDCWYELQQATRPDFDDAKVIYEGGDTATTLSGRPNGDYYYRVRNRGSAWSEIRHVVVAHHPLGRALLFLGLGAVVFLATVLLIVLGHLKHRKEEMARAGNGA